MKKIILVAVIACTMTSCYVHEYTIGKGAQKGITKTEWNHFAVNGLAPIKTAQPEEMANGAKDYTVKTRFSFINYIISGLTYSLYTPTTTTVTK